MENSNEAMREALEFVAHMNDSPYTTYDVLVAVQKARAALAKPPRQCDVGTAEEQEKRFRECCGCRCMTKCKVYEKGIALGIVNKNNYYKVGCRFVWEQMPYEGGDK